MIKHKDIKCPRCGFTNLYGTRKCYKCRLNIDPNTKPCPKCAKINVKNATYCVSCRYDFTGKNRGLIENLVLTIIIVGVLFALTMYKDENIVLKFSKEISLVAIIILILLVIKSIRFGIKHTAPLTVEEEIAEDTKLLKIMKAWSNVAVVIGAMLVLGYLIYYNFFR